LWVEQQMAQYGADQTPAPPAADLLVEVVTQQTVKELIQPVGFP